MRLCLLPSPLATPALARRLAAALEGRGHRAVVAEGGGTDTTEVLAGFVDAARDADVVVPHSNAGRFAPWSTWWAREDVEAVIGEHWDLLVTDEPRVPLRLLLEEPPAPQDWLTRRSGYVAFGHGYAEQAALAEANGWEVRRLDGDHLHLLTAPDEVAQTALDVVERLG